MYRHVIPGLAMAWLAAVSGMSSAADSAGATGVLHYPPAPRGTTVDVYHGTEVADPYRWMETSSPELSAWVTAQNAVSEPYLNAIPAREAIKKRLTELWDYEQYGYSWLSEKSRVPVKLGGRYFYVEKKGSQNQGILYWSDLARCGREAADRPQYALGRRDRLARRLLDQPRRPLCRLRGIGRRHGLGHLARARGRHRARPARSHRRHQVHRRILAARRERVLLLALSERRGRQGGRPAAGERVSPPARDGASRRRPCLCDAGKRAPQSLRHGLRGRALARLRDLLRLRQQRDPPQGPVETRCAGRAPVRQVGRDLRIPGLGWRPALFQDDARRPARPRDRGQSRVAGAGRDRAGGEIDAVPGEPRRRARHRELPRGRALARRRVRRQWQAAARRPPAGPRHGDRLPGFRQGQRDLLRLHRLPDAACALSLRRRQGRGDDVSQADGQLRRQPVRDGAGVLYEQGRHARADVHHAPEGLEAGRPATRRCSTATAASTCR